MAKYDWKVEPRNEDWSDDTYAYFLIHINLKRMVEYLTKEFKKDWWFKADYGQDNCYIVAENNNFPVRLFFTFDEGGWADITRHYTDGATLKDDHLGSWHFGKYDVDYSYAVIRDNIENYFYKFEESMKKEKKSIKESKDKFIIWSNEGYLDFEGDPSNNISDEEYYMVFDNKKDAEKYVDSLKKKYDNKWSDSLEIHNADEMFEESKKSVRKSLTESFEYESGIPLEELMNILDDEWKYSRGGLFGESSHWDDESRDEDRYIEISAIADFTIPISTGYSFTNKKVDNEYYKEVNKVWKDVDGDDEKYFDVLAEYEPILFILTIDLKELLVYAEVDLGNGLGDTEVARERLADNEKDFRKQIQRMIDAF